MTKASLAAVSEWFKSTFTMMGIVIVSALVARGPAFRHATEFWIPWTVFAAATLAYVLRRAYLLRTEHPAVHTRVDTVLMSLYGLFGVASFLVLYAQGFRSH
ncbi:hypothetical protein MFUL124B02_02445 [Myxococcus fulvus 124B02]|nr:hypothetical protein MFUL124B02_02445 [Myxococcus fulvus 124B02]